MLVVGSWGDDFGDAIERLAFFEDRTVLPKTGIDDRDLGKMAILERSLVDIAPPKNGLLRQRDENHLSSRLEACASPSIRRILANPPANNSGKSGVNLQSASLRVIPTQ